MLRIAVLCSRRAPGLAEALSEPAPEPAPWRVVVCVTSENDCSEGRVLDAVGVPLIRHDIQEFYSQQRKTRLSGNDARHAYDSETLRLLAPYQPDLIVCCGYLYILSRTFLDAYPEAVVNLHHSDLCSTREDGLPKYPGLRAVRDAILAGESETRSTVHLVTDVVDGGPPLIRSWAFPVAEVAQIARSWGAIDILKAYSYAHEQWMLRSAWPALLRCTFERFARSSRGELEPGVPWETSAWQPDAQQEVVELDRSGLVFSIEPSLHDELALAGV